MDNVTTTKSKLLTRWRSDPIWIIGAVVGLLMFLLYVAYDGYTQLLILIVGPVDSAAPNADLLIAFYVIALALYASRGFTPTGAVYDDELELATMVG